MSDWIWVLITALLVFLGISLIGNSDAPISSAATSETLLNDTSHTQSAVSAEATPESIQEQGFGSAFGNPSAAGGNKIKFDLWAWSPFLVIFLLVATIRLAQFIRNRSVYRQLPSIGPSPSQS